MNIRVEKDECVYIYKLVCPVRYATHYTTKHVRNVDTGQSLQCYILNVPKCENAIAFFELRSKTLNIIVLGTGVSIQ